MDLEKLGHVFDDSNVIKSVKKQNPFTIEYPNSIASKNVKNIAIKLTNDNVFLDNNHDSNNFFKKFVNFFK